MNIWSKIRDFLVPSDGVALSGNITRQELVDEIYRHFIERFNEETTTESMLFPTAFYVYMNEEDYNLRSQSLSNTVKDVVNKMKRFISKRNGRYGNYVPHAKYWLFQFAPMSADTFLEGMPDDASALEPKQLYIISTIYPEDNEDTGGNTRLVGTLHIKNSFKINNLAINPAAFIGLDILGKNRFRVPFTDLSSVQAQPASEAGVKASREKTKATLTLQQQEYCFFTNRMGGRSYVCNIISDSLFISGKNEINDTHEDAPVIRINSEMVLNPHLQIRATGDGQFSLMPFGTVRLNEQVAEIRQWHPLSHHSTILINDEIQMLFKRK